MKKRPVLVFSAFGIILCVSVLIAIAVGTVDVPVSRTTSILFHSFLKSRKVDWAPWEETVLLWVRLPRVLLAALVGGGLAVCGAVMQSVFRNPMADPGILGVSAGASLGAVLILYSGASAISFALVPMGAFAGALTCVFLVYALASSRGKASVATLLLAGITINSIAGGLISFVLGLSLKRFELGRQILAWLMGQLEGRSWGHVALAAPIVLVGCPWLFLYGRELNVLLIGEDNAMAVGLDVPRTRRNLLIVTSLVTAATVSVAGSISFVGLIIPHIVRLLLGPDNRKTLPGSFLLGAAFLVLADVLCRYWPDRELRLGVITSLLGGPFFLYLLLRSRHKVNTAGAG